MSSRRSPQDRTSLRSCVPAPLIPATFKPPRLYCHSHSTPASAKSRLESAFPGARS